MTTAEQMLKMWDLPWSVVDVLLSGKSALDITDLQVNTQEEATDFIVGYGYDPSNPKDQRIMHGFIVEAINFIVTKLLTQRDISRGVYPPKEIWNCSDPSELLIWSSQRGGSRVSSWACAVLRVMHTIIHIDGVTQYANIDIARDQIMKRFEGHIFRDKAGILWMGDENEKVRIEKVEWKHDKTRDSIIMKLLHKRDNVAETIYDRLGIRIIPTRLCDVMMVVKFLRSHHMITFTNCVPTRSRSNLIDLDRFKVQIENLRNLLEHGQLTAKDFDTLLGRINYDGEVTEEHNPHSSSAYKSVQLTCRQLIRTRNPELGWLDKINRNIDQNKLTLAKANVLKELKYFVEHWHTVRDHREVKAFFPFEIQIIDGNSYQQILTGEANHDKYKASQVRAARKRVLAQVFANVRGIS